MTVGTATVGFLSSCTTSSVGLWSCNWRSSVANSVHNCNCVNVMYIVVNALFCLVDDTLLLISCYGLVIVKLHILCMTVKKNCGSLGYCAVSCTWVGVLSLLLSTPGRFKFGGVQIRGVTIPKERGEECGSELALWRHPCPNATWRPMTSVRCHYRRVFRRSNIAYAALYIIGL